jgi:hypothetical protein
MIANLRAWLDQLDAAVGERTAAYDHAERALVEAARAAAGTEGGL